VSFICSIVIFKCILLVVASCSCSIALCWFMWTGWPLVTHVTTTQTYRLSTHYSYTITHGPGGVLDGRIGCVPPPKIIEPNVIQYLIQTSTKKDTFHRKIYTLTIKNELTLNNTGRYNEEYIIENEQIYFLYHELRTINVDYHNVRCKTFPNHEIVSTRFIIFLFLYKNDPRFEWVIFNGKCIYFSMKSIFFSTWWHRVSYSCSFFPEGNDSEFVRSLRGPN
jgi:hypothetical protein